MQLFNLLPVILSIGSALAANYTVIVGNNNTLTYQPSNITGVLVGDMINFVFVAGNHSVTQSSFAEPCQNLTSGGLDSGFQKIQDNSTMAMQYSFTMTNASVPLWFYCRQTAPKNHCQNGMVFAVNPTAEKSYAQFLATAMASSNSTNSTSSSSSAAPSGSASATDSNASSASAGSAGAQSTDSSSSTATSSGSSASATTSQPSSAGSIKVGMTTSMLLAGFAASLML